jgi:hypothetical protein
MSPNGNRFARKNNAIIAIILFCEKLKICKNRDNSEAIIASYK